MTLPTKLELYDRGRAAVGTWCVTNDIVAPTIQSHMGRPTFGTCAFYRSGVIAIWVHSCAAPELRGRVWSYPGYSVDRTPYGVLAHELGHHVDGAHGHSGGRLSHEWIRETGEDPIGGYAPHPNEWFAEMFRLFVTNPDLLRALRPRTWARMRDRWEPIERRPWREILTAESDRWLNAASRKVTEASRRYSRETQGALL